MKIGEARVSFPRLPGVAADVDSVAALLHSAGAQVTKLIQPEDTSAADISYEILTRVDALQAGETLLVYFSGHGYRVKDTTSPTGYREMLVCADHPVEDEFTRRLRDRLQEGRRLIFIVDACHAGGFVRGLTTPTLAPTFILPRTGSSIIWWSAALDEQRAFQTKKKKLVYSAFTFSLLQAWDYTPNVSYKDLWQGVWNAFGSNFGNLSQTPALWLEADDATFLDDPAFKA